MPKKRFSIFYTTFFLRFRPFPSLSLPFPKITPVAMHYEFEYINYFPYYCDNV